MKVAEPEKELRFTRAQQAVPFLMFSAICFTGALTLLVTSYYRDVNPDLPHPLWSVPLFGIAAIFAWLSVHLIKHAYIILSPVGVEIFPFFRPSKNMQLILWQQVKGGVIDLDRNMLTFHFNKEKNAGVHLSLSPIKRKSRSLLAKALEGRLSKAQR